MTSFRVDYPIPARNPKPIPLSSRVVGVAGLAILFGNYRGAGPKQSCFRISARRARQKFAVKHVKIIMGMIELHV